ncbi:MAG: hypothetical protein ACOH2E_05920 [Candidatus Paracaedibacter sp.]
MATKKESHGKTNLKLQNFLCCDFCKSLLGTLCGTILGGALTLCTASSQIEKENKRFWSQEAISYLSNAEKCTNELINQLKQFGEYIIINDKLDSHIIKTQFSQPINIKIRTCKNNFRKLNLSLKKSGCAITDGKINYSFFDQLKDLFEVSVKEPSKHNGRCIKDADYCKDTNVELNDIILEKINPQIEKIYKDMESCN